jgi:hypothetical protein
MLSSKQVSERGRKNVRTFPKAVFIGSTGWVYRWLAA